jgi:hypothetical protein
VFSDNQKYCSTWLEKFTLGNAFVYLVAAGIAFVNIVVKTLLRCKPKNHNLVFLVLSKFESAHTKTAEIFSTMLKMFIVQFVNTGIVIFLVNA